MDAVYAASVKLPFHGLSPRRGESRNSDRLIAESHRLITADVGGRIGLFAGHKKDIVQRTRAGKVTIYGGFRANGTLVQPLSSVHSESYYDYSHAVRLVRQTTGLSEVLRGETRLGTGRYPL